MHWRLRQSPQPRGMIATPLGRDYTPPYATVKTAISAPRNPAALAGKLRSHEVPLAPDEVFRAHGPLALQLHLNEAKNPFARVDTNGSIWLMANGHYLPWRPLP